MSNKDDLFYNINMIRHIVEKNGERDITLRGYIGLLRDSRSIDFSKLTNYIKSLTNNFALSEDEEVNIENHLEKIIQLSEHYGD